MTQLALFLPDSPGPPEFEPLPALLDADMQTGRAGVKARE
jgi:hypothetical protein